MIQPQATVPPSPVAPPVPAPAPVRVAHLVSHPVPYFAPLYRELAARDEIDLTVYFYSDASVRPYRDCEFGRIVAWQRDLLDGYRWSVLPSARGRRLRAGLDLRPSFDVVRAVARGGYDVVWAHGYAHLTTWLAAAAARTAGAAFLLREEQTLLDPRPPHRRALKQVALRALFSQAAGLYIGRQNRCYLEHYGMSALRLFPAPYCVDNGLLQKRAVELAPRRAEIRESLGLPGDVPLVLFCGKLIEKKQPLALIEAFARVRQERPCSLLLVGEGALRGAAEALVERLAVPDVAFAGFLPEPELPLAYAAADLLVLPSAFRETWGLVVNEAMNFSLPIVVTDKVGCAYELVRPGWNGYVVPAYDVAALADAVGRLLADDRLRRLFGGRSQRLVARYSVEICADGIVAACLAAPSRRRQA